MRTGTHKHRHTLYRLCKAIFVGPPALTSIYVPPPLHQHVILPCCSLTEAFCTFLSSLCRLASDPSLGWGRCNKLKVQAGGGLFTHLVKRDSMNPSTLQTRQNKQLLCPLLLHFSSFVGSKAKNGIGKTAFSFSASSVWNAWQSEMNSIWRQTVCDC